MPEANDKHEESTPSESLERYDWGYGIAVESSVMDGTHDTLTLHDKWRIDSEEFAPRVVDNRFDDDGGFRLADEAPQETVGSYNGFDGIEASDGQGS